MGTPPSHDDEEFGRKVDKDVKDNWAGLVVDTILLSTYKLREKLHRVAKGQPECEVPWSEVEPLLGRIRQDAQDLKKTLVEHGLIPVLRDPQKE